MQSPASFFGTPRSRPPRSAAGPSTAHISTRNLIHSTPRRTTDCIPASNVSHPMYSFTESEEAGDEMTLQDMVALQSVTMNQLQQQVESLKNDSAVLKAASEVQQAELAELKQKLSASRQCSSSERIPRSLSNLLQTLYASMDVQFEVCERFDSSSNQAVRCALHREIGSQEGQYGKTIIKRAIFRLFEKHRRSWNESHTIPPQKVQADSKKRRVAARRRRLYIRRSKYIQSAQEREWWEQLDSNIMTDESSGEDDSILVHHLSWRSTAANDLIEKLDARYEQDYMDTQRHRPLRKHRVESSPSSRAAPGNAPDWAIRQS